jgi:hypothetical protein
MVFMEIFVNKCLSLVFAQDLGSKVYFASDHWLVSSNPVLEMMNMGCMGEMDVRAPVEICCTAMVETQTLELVQCLWGLAVARCICHCASASCPCLALLMFK